MGSPAHANTEGGTAISLRPAKMADAPFFAALYAESRRDEVAAFGWPAELADTFLRQQHLFREQGYRATYPGSAPEVIARDGQASGRVWVSRSEPVWVLVDVALSADQQNRGIGTAVVAALQAQARQAGVGLRLSVLPGSRARALYARLGFTELQADPMYVQLEWRPSAAREALDAR